METHSVMMQLAKAMSIKPANFTYAGTKDKRGITTQKCTIYRGNMERLEMLNRAGPELDTFNFLVGNARYVPEKLNLGDLKGNRFGMTIRSIPIDISHEQINHAVTNWAQKGFINYFGLQRFGTKSIPTHKIGLSILRHDFKRTVELLLDPQEGDASKIFEARQKFKETGNVDEALRTLPPYLVAEKAVLEGLKHHGTEAYAQAIQRIPRHLRMMYTHSYQSFVWNSVVNERLTKYPTDRCILGDLVIPADAAATWEEEDTTLNEDEDDQATSIEPESLSHKRRRLNEEIHVIEITLENIDHYSINDVVLPMPGYAIQYPKNHLKQLYEKILQNDGVDFEKLLKTTGAEYHLPGTFRHILRKPIDVQYEIKDYNDPSIPLMRTDVDILMEKDPPKSIPDGKYRALCLEFQLGSSSYATMALRELLKQSSSLSAQLKLNKDAEDISN
jgi:tRNA pseudouridine13 synthase